MESIEQQIDRFFNPRGVAIIGASRRPGRIGHIIVEQMVASKYPGRLYLINPEAAQDGHHICGIKTYASLKDCSGPIDLAVIVIPSKYVPPIIQECVDKEVPNVIIVSGGFREAGPEGAKLEEQVLKIAQKGNIRILGPNCLGTFSPKSHIDTLFLPERTTPRPGIGRISFLSQSGSVGGSIMSFAYNEKIGFSKFASFGNALDVDEGDLIDYLEDDEDTQVTGLYLESISRGRKFIDICRRACKVKPFIVIKAGRSEAGTRAVSSHTGSLAGTDRIYDAAFEAAGIIRVKDIGEFFDVARALANQPPAKGNRVGVITSGGGFGVMTLDALSDYGLDTPELSESLQKRLHTKLPFFYSVRNPVDLTGSATAEQFAFSMNTLLDSDEVDGLIVIPLFMTPLLDAEQVSQAIVEASEQRRKPILVVSVPSTKEIRKRMFDLRLAGVPAYHLPMRGARAMAGLVEYGEIIRRPEE
ncbi:MAG: acetate--CoA ligase family protein [Candidatus Hodarchaeota archaeon]